MDADDKSAACVQKPAWLFVDRVSSSQSTHSQRRYRAQISTSARHRIRHGIRHTATRVWTASLPVCRKRPFATHVDRLRPRLEGRRLPVAGAAARSPAGSGRQRRPRYHDCASGVRDDRPGLDSCLTRAPDGRRARRLEARPPRPHPGPHGQHRAGPVGQRRGPQGQLREQGEKVLVS